MKEQQTCINFRKPNTLDENHFNLMEAATGHHAPGHEAGGAGKGADRGVGTGAGRGADKA